MQNSISFFLNGKPVVLKKTLVDTLLIDYLRSPQVHLAGAKKPCGQGGCGGCTVILSSWNAHSNTEEHCAINSCLRPLIAVDGMVVTTVEGTGAARRPNPEYLTHNQIASRGGSPATMPLPQSVISAFEEAQTKRAEVLESVNKSKDVGSTTLLIKTEIPRNPSEVTHLGVNPVAHRLALNNGTQCGYCTVGFVMNMTEFLANNPTATKKEIEDIFDGNICRCTGYRPILTGMKTFAADWTSLDEEERMKCIGDDAVQLQKASEIVIPFPKEAKKTLQGSSGQDEKGRLWIRPVTLSGLLEKLKEYEADKPLLINANTAYGIYKQDFLTAKVIIDIRLVPELNGQALIGKDGIKIYSATTFSSLIKILEDAIAEHTDYTSNRDADTTPWGALLFMAKRTAGRIVRNAGTLGGNTMLVFKHIVAGTGEPFPSDSLTALAAIGAVIEYVDSGKTAESGIEKDSVESLCDKIIADPSFAERIILLSYFIPIGSGSVVLSQKVALRDVNAHSIVNSAISIQVDSLLQVQNVSLVYGGLAPYPWHAAETESLMKGKILSLENIPNLFVSLVKEAEQVMAFWKLRMNGLPDEGFTELYRIQLVTAMFYKAVIKTLLENGATVPANIRSSGMITWGKWPVSNGHQFYQSQSFKAPVTKPYVKFTAMEQASGQLHYTHEYAVPINTVNAALVQSKRALANYFFVVPNSNETVNSTRLRHYLTNTFEDFIDIVTHEAFKNGALNFQGMGSDQPIFAVEQVDFVGQTIALIGAKSEQSAIMIADYVSEHCVGYSPVDMHDKPRWNRPIMGIDAALENNSIFPDWPTTASFNSHIWQITRPGSQLGWMKNRKPLDKKIYCSVEAVDGNICQVVGSTQLTGGQAHFYMETQAAIAEPIDGARMIIYSSTQSPMTIHETIAQSLGVQYNAVDVRVPPVGGGFGGKTEQTRCVAAAVAVAAKALKRPVRLALSREQDTALIGKRHAYYAQYQIAIDNGETTPANKGMIRGLSNKMWGDGGAFYDCSFIVSNCIITRSDNAYRINNFQAQIDVCRTNSAPSTAFRAFGDVQGKVMLENAIDDAAFSIGMTAEEVREKNLYDRGDVTPFGQPLSYCYMKEVWAYVKKVSLYDQKMVDVQQFNKENKWRKRGISIVPVKYGSGYNLTMLEQAGAMVSVYQGDGSIIIHQGGVEMGQGLLTVVRQVASFILNVPMTLIEVESPKTSIITNPTSTGASTGTTYSAEAVKRVCEQLRSRLVDFGYDLLKNNGNDWCVQQGVDFWNYGVAGWNHAPNSKVARHPLIWQNLIGLAYQQRISLTASLNIPIKGGETPIPNLTYKDAKQQPVVPGIKSDPAGTPGEFDSFSGFTYSAACTVVEVDILTGETKVLSSDIVYDIGWSMNPAIDVGQVEGAFVQGLGYVLSEKLVFEPEGIDEGRLNTLNTWTYKPPATTSIPLEMNVHLFPRDLAASVPENPADILSSKEVGEPPLVLAVTAFFAVKAAVRASRIERGLSGLFRLDSPATVQETRRACELSNTDF